jgi:DNA-binding MarR family transcriptional regulator
VLLKKAERRYRLHTSDYARLAAFRGQLREFLRFSEDAAAAVGLTAQHYQAMLELRAAPDGAQLSINDLAGKLLIRHNSAVGLVDRLEGEGLIMRKPSAADRRKVELKLSAKGRQVLSQLAAMHRAELERIGPALRRLIADVFRHDPSQAD